MIQLQPNSIDEDEHAAIAYVNQLADIANYFNDESDDCASALKEYKQNLINICGTLTDANIIDLLLILVDGVDRLIDGEVDLQNSHCRFLSKLPILINDCLSYGDSKMPATVLIRHMASSKWVRPLSKEEESYFINQVVRGSDAKISLINNQGADDVVDLLNFEISETDEVSHSEELIDNNTESVEDVSELDLSAFIEENTDIENTDLQYPQDLSVSYEESDDIDLSGIQQDQEVYEVESLDLGEMKSDRDPEPEEIDLSSYIDTDILNDLAVQENKEVASIPDVESGKSNISSVEGEKLNQLDSRQQELVDLVCSELEDVIETNTSYINDDSIDIPKILTETAEESENIGNAVDLLGLQGLSKYCKLISNSIHHIEQDVGAISNINIKQFLNWPQAIHNYLKNVFDESAIDPLLGFIKDNDYLFKINDEDVNDLVKLLSSPSFAEEEVQQRQQKATQEDVDLSLPEDVNQELLDGLLQDLPAQTEEFSSSIQNISESGDIHYLEIAQRIAHTLKGAANVVGVKGIANLTHHLEDILEIQTKAKKIPIAPLMDVLLNASDCLEAMTEALLGIDNPPDDALQVLQSILDWANKLDRDGVTEDAVSIDNNQHLIKSLNDTGVKELHEKKASHDSVSSENMLRVPASLADELLRLAGENLITTGQIQDRIKNTLKHYSHLKIHNQSLQQLSFDLEHLVDIQGITNNLNLSSRGNGADFDPLEMDEFHELHSVSRRLIELSADSFELSKVLEHEVTELNNLVITQDNIQKESQQLVLRTRMVPVKTIVPRLKRGIRQAGRVTGKQVELIVNDNDTYLDSEVLNDLIEPIMHILRNSVDHGIESSEERKVNGKPENGIIELTFSRMGDLVVINVKDDGRGLDEEKILARAMQKGFVRKDQTLSRDELFRIILEQGFSTREEVTQVSGRGIGLDVVNVKIRDLKGMINIYSDKGAGTRLELILPVSSFSTHSLLIRVRQNIYAISSRGIEEILYPSLGKLSDMGNEMIFQVDDQAYSAIILDQLLNLPKDPRTIDRNARPVIIVKEETGARRAVLVQDVLDSRDVVVKPLGKYLPKMDGIVGATILGDGSVAPVIDLPELLQKTRTSTRRDAGSAHTVNQSKEKRLPYVLVVDDSLSARRSLTQFVQDLGMNVRSARDGMEAVSLIEAGMPDLVIIDMEMPRMNGLELTSHIRGTESTSDIPIVMITSRSSDKHKKAAIERGVNHFMVKPFSEDELAKYINTSLEIA